MVVALATLGLSFEVDRLVVQAHEPRMLWPAVQIKQFGWTMLWTVAAVAVAFACRRLAFPSPLPWILLGLLAVKFLTVDTLEWYLGSPTVLVPVLLNLQVATAVTLLAGFAATFYLTRAGEVRTFDGAGFLALAALAVLVFTWAGMLEIDRRRRAPANRG